ncbi:TPA: EexN family lipoprotein [Pseudomonas aeruginosa]|uniref:EexN family lipoprotein n=1 Tax=Pseudomonas aeruginosa TaxID=287 RepID=UPI002D7AC09E|nr:EexN family lipoprotein [Pseudomonas aeruginosa]HBO4604607.1 EexN family lipoprotein [Pseudomonas aeruginosa]HCF6078534.1 EexN family lipoprotein [Pseudomonas aeruginosa]HDQ4067617.1 EexN family lipoprotein [Pseudomonas aeruginosa]HEP8275599.1 EexN family lipoprotein [Pseudomonas aeruginosa]
MRKTNSCALKLILLTSLISLSGCKEPTKDELLNDASLASAWKRKCENFKERANEHEGCLNLRKAEVDESLGLLIRILSKNNS